MRVFLSALIVVLAAGCGKATMVKTPYPWNKFTPSNTSEDGIVSYRTDYRSHADNDAARFSAYRLMEYACRGPYEASEPVPVHEPPVSTVNNALIDNHKVNLIHFRCLPHDQLQADPWALGSNTSSTVTNIYFDDINVGPSIKVPISRRR